MLSLAALRLVILGVCVMNSLPKVLSKEWRNSGNGRIVLEEAWTVPELIHQIGNTSAALGGTNAELKANLLDIHNQRRQFMDENNIDFMVVSCANPCIQGLSDPVEAENMAVTVNNRLAETIANDTERFGGFASLSMHNATNAALELNRTVTELGFVGALVNDYQQSGPDNTTLLYYDQPEYDVFWQMVSDLDVPVYFHPRSNIAQIGSLMTGHARWLKGPAQEFAATLSNHILGLCTNGVFDRFPKAKIIVGHLGERIPSDLGRIDEQLLRQIPNGIPMKLNVSSYWQTNIWETTSGNFQTPLMKFHMDTIGLNRIMYSVDYPYVAIPEGEAWLQTLPSVLSAEELNSLTRNVAIEVLGLNK
ncbi:hypothetical protein Agabi119p4_11320 [Agaricus bisporus var. burnettii]|uniref:Amidohydrolase-related domain-containing protein n=1 Tax=Agaricus bisporus var. burnettii TaxID=192524 RepID=A0A8H7EVM3_AGABI|nr:hypothetical protein Agabi119p4_11320 [Agaricus bisporus var. burnettii]